MKFWDELVVDDVDGVPVSFSVSRSDSEVDDLDDFLSSCLCSTRSFSLFTLWIAPLMAGKASQYLKFS